MLVERLAAFAAGTIYEALPAEVVDSVKRRMLDTVGIALAASARGLADGVREMAAEDGGVPRASVIGGTLRMPEQQAAFVNGVLAHSLDFDDTHLPSVLHPSASVVPAVLAMAEGARTSGREAIRAAAVGIEITVRLGMGGYVEREGNVFFERGWHATSICGTLGSAASAGLLLGLDAERIAHAMAIASSFASGVLEGNRVGGTVKRLHCGWAAHAGITAARLAAHGFTGPRSVLEGRFGFFHAFLDGHANEAAVVHAIGKRWELPGIVFKAYPANHYTHAGIDAALRLRSRGVRPEAIERLELGKSAPELRTIGEPREEKVHPRSGYHAQFSGPFTVATALLGGGGLGVYFDDFTDEKTRDPRLLALAEKVETFVDESCDKAFPHAFPAVLRAHLRDGSVVEERVMHLRGTRENPLPEADLRRKYELNASAALPPDRIARLADEVMTLERRPSVAAMLGLTR